MRIGSAETLYLTNTHIYVWQTLSETLKNIREYFCFNKLKKNIWIVANSEYTTIVNAFK